MGGVRGVQQKDGMQDEQRKEDTGRGQRKAQQRWVHMCVRESGHGRREERNEGNVGKE